MEVTISKDASPTPGADGRPLLDINMATPNGVSNHLLIKMRTASHDRKPGQSDEWDDNEPPLEAPKNSSTTKEKVIHAHQSKPKGN
jgi:hypothetical protein